MHAHITTFEIKLPLWETQVAIDQFLHFPRFVVCPGDVDLDSYLSTVASLKEEFTSCFAIVRSVAVDLKLFTAPFDTLVHDAKSNLQMEMWSCSATMN